MKTRSPRSSFHHAVVTSFGARRSTSRTNATAQRRTSRKPPLGPVLRHALLVDRLALGAVRVPLQLRRALVEHAHDALADCEVVLNEVELRLAARAEEDLVRVRHLDGARPDLELDERRLRRH